ncbi:hypothetical protein PFISCL1PPCAC_10816, partial [Pristionchus fissidentatus]
AIFPPSQSSLSPLEIQSPLGDQPIINYRSIVHRSDSKRSSRILLEQELNSPSLTVSSRSDRPSLPKPRPFMPQSENPLEDELFHQLFRIYSYFAERNDGMLLNEKEAHFILDELLKEADRPNTSSSVACSTSDTVSFREMLGLIDVIFPERKVLEPLVDRIFERLVTQVIRKGFLLSMPSSSHSCLPFPTSSSSWIPTWCTLTPGFIHLQPLHKKLTADNKRSIVVERDARVVLEDDEESSGIYSWVIHSGREEYRFAHFDLLQRNSFARDMALIIERPTRTLMAQYDVNRAAFNDGRAEREHALRLGLEEENKRLAKTVEDERRALKDEEIVRGLATRMLEEEKGKNEQMEKLLAELQNKLAKRYALNSPSFYKYFSEDKRSENLDDDLPAPPLIRRRVDGREADDEMEKEDEREWEEGMIISTTSI